jgi:hypothetical protein
MAFLASEDCLKDNSQNPINMTSTSDTSINTSLTISQKLMMVLCEIASEKDLLRHIEQIMMCYTPAEGGLFNGLVALISPTPEGIRPVRFGYQVWRTLRFEDRLSVLDCFLKLFYQQTKDISPAQRVELFCRLFICNLIPVLEEYKSFNLSDSQDSEIENY